MAATYPNQLTGGVTDLGRFDPFDLFGGGFSEHPTAQGVAADGQAIEQFQVISLNAGGRVVPFVVTGYFATGTIAFGANPAAADTLTLNGTAITFRASNPAAGEVLIGATPTATAQNLKALINSAFPLYGMSADGTGATLNVTAAVVGVAGNGVTLAKSGAQPVVPATLTGAVATTPSPTGAPVGIACQPVAAATPGKGCPYYVGGGFNREALVWPAGLVSLAQQRQAFARTPITVHQLL